MLPIANFFLTRIFYMTPAGNGLLETRHTIKGYNDGSIRVTVISPYKIDKTLVVHESDTNDPDLLRKSLKIDRVALELQRVTEHNAIDRGMVIPVWNFYGSVEYEYNFEWDHDRNGLPKSLLTINAVDGSVIDAWQGA